MAYLPPAVVAQAIAAGRKSQQRPPELYEKMGITLATAGEVNQPVAETVAVRQIDRTNQDEGRTMKHAGGAINQTETLEKKRSDSQQTMLMLGIIALLAFSLMRRE